MLLVQRGASFPSPATPDCVAIGEKNADAPRGWRALLSMVLNLGSLFAGQSHPPPPPTPHPAHQAKDPTSALRVLSTFHTVLLAQLQGPP